MHERCSPVMFHDDVPAPFFVFLLDAKRYDCSLQTVPCDAAECDDFPFITYNEPQSGHCAPQGQHPGCYAKQYWIESDTQVGRDSGFHFLRLFHGTTRGVPKNQEYTIHVEYHAIFARRLSHRNSPQRESRRWCCGQSPSLGHMSCVS